MTKKPKKIEQELSRRAFMRGSAAAGVGAVVVATLPKEALAQPEPEPADESKGKGYQLSSHVLAYYKTTAS